MIGASEVMRRLRGQTRAAGIRAVRREVTGAVAGQSRRVVMRLALDLVRAGGPGRFVAYELVACHRESIEGISADEVVRLGRGLSHWGDVDSYCGYVVGPAWRRGRIPDNLIHSWAGSEDRWWRRAALVATVPLNLKSRGGTGDARRTLAVCGLLIADRDDMVVKAMSWALRALAVREPDAVREFVARHRGELAARVVREVHNKLVTGVKNPKGRSARAPSSSPPGCRRNNDR